MGDELDALIESLGTAMIPPADPGQQTDRAAELQAKRGTAPGRLWTIPSKATPGGEHRLLCGDSTRAADVERVMGGEKADLCLTDPPYGINLQNHAPGKERSNRSFEIAGDKSSDAGIEVLAQCADVPTVVFASPMKPWPGVWKQFLVWDKGDSVGVGGDPETYWRSSWELVQVRNTGKLNGDRDPSVLKFPVASSDYSNHPTEKPAQLICYLIEKTSQPGETILDPFCGSGTTIVAAEQTGRLCPGREINTSMSPSPWRRLAGMGLEPRLAE